MAIPEAQLDTWSKQGASAQSRDTYATIKLALENNQTKYATKSFRVFLQGSYGNDTHVYRESDVDVVICLDSTYYHDLSRLSPEDLQAFQNESSPASYSWQEFKIDVLEGLRSRFGGSVSPGNRAIKIAAGEGRRSADVIVAAQYRRYYSYKSILNQSYDEGIYFLDGNGRAIDNFPKQHSDNCTEKHQNSISWFKPMVRIFKNMRNKMIEQNMISADIAPSYFIEGLLYNVPNTNFSVNYGESVAASINWLRATDRSSFVCANKLYYLLRTSPVTWDADKCTKFLDQAATLWNSW